MINIQNKQRKFDIKPYKIEQKLNLLLDVLGYKKYDVGLLITTNKTIASYNQMYREKDKPTDILSFPYHPHLKAGEKIVVNQVEDKNLGDMIISLEYVEKDAENLGVTLLDRIDVLLVHGVCHLLGYDHIIDADYLVMKKEEERLLELLREKFYK
jgi:probable rRNA maturation factor